MEINFAELIFHETDLSRGKRTVVLLLDTANLSPYCNVVWDNISAGADGGMSSLHLCLGTINEELKASKGILASLKAFRNVKFM